MDPISVTVGIISLIDSLNTIIQRYRYLSGVGSQNVAHHDIFGELSVLLNVLAESKTLTDELFTQPLSLRTALRQCRQLEKQLGDQLDKMSYGKGKMMQAIMFASSRAPLVETVIAFRRAVILFRDIATNALTIQLLRTAPGTKFNVSNNEGKLYPADSKLLAGSTHNEGVTQQQKVQSQLPLLSGPAENSTLFNGTISRMVDVEASSLSQPQRDALGAPCVCGRSRMGIWFPVRGKFDTGSNTDFISKDAIERARLETFVYEPEVSASLTMFGHTTNFNEKISLNWQLNNHAVSYTVEFWVASATDNFDLIIGDPWLKKQGYEFIGTHQSLSRTFAFFGDITIRLARGTREQKRADKEAAAQRRAKGNEQLEKRRATALDPATAIALRPGLFPAAESTSTGTTGPSMSASQPSNDSRSITPTGTIIGPVASGGNPHAVPNQMNTHRNPPP